MANSRSKESAPKRKVTDSSSDPDYYLPPKLQAIILRILPWVGAAALSIGTSWLAMKGTTSQNSSDIAAINSSILKIETNMQTARVEDIARFNALAQRVTDLEKVDIQFAGDRKLVEQTLSKLADSVAVLTRDIQLINSMMTDKLPTQINSLNERVTRLQATIDARIDLLDKGPRKE